MDTLATYSPLLVLTFTHPRDVHVALIFPTTFVNPVPPTSDIKFEIGYEYCQHAQTLPFKVSYSAKKH